MRITKYEWFVILGWGLPIGLTVAGIAVSEAVGLRAEWEDLIVLTIVVFTVLITSLRSFWSLVAFWRNLAFLFAGHLLAVLIAVQLLPQRRFGIPKLLLTAVGVAETFLIGTVLWKTASSAKFQK